MFIVKAESFRSVGLWHVPLGTLNKKQRGISMKRLFTIGAGLLSLIILVPCASAQDGPPKAPVHEVADTYFGQKIVDPYRWMEDSKSPETAAWMKAQADYSRAYLDRLPLRHDLFKRVEQLSETGVRVTGVQRAGKLYFFLPSGARRKRSQTLRPRRL